jgi:hypothetical protein
MRALFGMLSTAIIGITFTFILKSSDETEPGLTVETISIAKQKYKGSDIINEEEGEIVRGLSLEMDDTLLENEILVPQKYMEKMKAFDGDLIYISDNRRRLGGLRAGHVKATSLKGNGVNNTIRISYKTMNKCYLIKDKPISLEKIF